MNNTASHSLSKPLLWLVLISILVPNRGALIIYGQLPASLVYGLSTLFILGLSAIGLLFFQKIKIPDVLHAKNLFILNLFLGLYYCALHILSLRLFDAGILYIIFFPFLTILFLQVDAKRLENLFLLSGLILSLSILINIYGVASSGIEYLLNYNQTLRPETGGVSSSGESYRIGGFTGSYHDSANLMGMFSIYCLLTFITNKSIKYLFLGILFIFCLLVTLSAANIILTGFVIFISIFYYFRFYIPIIYFFIFISLIFLIFIFPQMEIFEGLVARILQPDWDGLTRNLSIEMMLTPYFWVGFGQHFNSIYIDNEVAFLKVILSRGFIPSMLLFLLIIYPFLLFIKNSKFLFRVSPSAFSILFALLSLAHYGSLLRSTNLVIFFVLYTLFIKEYIFIKSTYEAWD